MPEITELNSPPEGHAPPSPSPSAESASGGLTPLTLHNSILEVSRPSFPQKEKFLSEDTATALKAAGILTFVGFAIAGGITLGSHNKNRDSQDS